MSTTVYRIRLDSRQFESKMSRLEGRVSRLEMRLRRLGTSGAAGSVAGGSRAGFMGLGVRGLAITAAAAGVGLVTKRIVQLGVEAERSKLTLSKLFGSKAVGEREFRETERFAAFTPFNFAEVLRQRISLGARGVSQRNQLPLLEIIGNYASVLGEQTLPFLSKAVGDVLAKGQLQGQEIRQFAEAGVSARKLVADLRGVSVGEVEGTFVSATEFMRALERGQAKGSVFFNAMKDASQTVAGRFETAKDLMDSTLRTLGQDLLPTISSALNSVVKGLNILQQSGVRGLFNDLVMVGEAFARLVTFNSEAGQLSGIKIFFDSVRFAANSLSLGLETILFSLKSIGNFFTEDIDSQRRIESLFSGRKAELLARQFDIAQNFGRLGKAPGALTSNLGGSLFHEDFAKGSLSQRPGTSAGGGATGVSGIRSAVRNVTINIENLIRDQNINGTTSLGQTSEDIKIQVERALQTVFAETRLAL